MSNVPSPVAVLGIFALATGLMAFFSPRFAMLLSGLFHGFSELLSRHAGGMTAAYAAYQAIWALWGERYRDAQARGDLEV